MTIKSNTVNTSAKLIHIHAVRDYAVSVIDHEGSTFEKLKFFFETFESEYGWENQRKGIQKSLTSYLQGLPSTINHAFTNHEIQELLIKWEYLTEKDLESNTVAGIQKVSDAIDNYFPMLAMALITLARRNKIID